MQHLHVNMKEHVELVFMAILLRARLGSGAVSKEMLHASMRMSCQQTDGVGA
jgi:hypothetical protein